MRGSGSSPSPPLALAKPKLGLRPWPCAMAVLREAVSRNLAAWDGREVEAMPAPWAARPVNQKRTGAGHADVETGEAKLWWPRAGRLSNKQAHAAARWCVVHPANGSGCSRL